jgi:malate dehydrogenase (oxaloacetate-decarboxylating)(NADP+)
LVRRDGVTEVMAKDAMRNRSTLIAAMLLRRGDVDSMLCGTSGAFYEHLHYVCQAIGPRPGVRTWGTMNMLILGGRSLFICDTNVNRDPTAEQISELTMLAAEEVRRFGLVPSVALLSHSSFGSTDSPSAQKMRDALKLIHKAAPELAVEGEMQGDAALSKRILDRVFPDSQLTGDANLLMMPNLDAANIAYNLLRVAASGGVAVGPILPLSAHPDSDGNRPRHPQHGSARSSRRRPDRNADTCEARRRVTGPEASRYDRSQCDLGERCDDQPDTA